MVTLVDCTGPEVIPQRCSCSLDLAVIDLDRAELSILAAFPLKEYAALGVVVAVAVDDEVLAEVVVAHGTCRFGLDYAEMMHSTREMILDWQLAT